jgi:hypothetical protein
MRFAVMWRQSSGRRAQAMLSDYLQAGENNKWIGV